MSVEINQIRNDLYECKVQIDLELMWGTYEGVSNWLEVEDRFIRALKSLRHVCDDCGEDLSIRKILCESCEVRRVQVRL